MGRVLQSPSWAEAVVSAWLSFNVIAALALVSVRDWSAVYATAWVSAALWVVGAVLQLHLRSSDWASGRVKPAGVVQACGLITLGLHVLLAFKKLGGTHADVVEHTRNTAGVGWGVYVNYLFAVVWLADTVWLTAATRSYARRPQWVGRAVHGFLAFVVFNATVVYGEPATRAAGAVWFAILGFSWWRRANGQRRASRSGPPDLRA